MPSRSIWFKNWMDRWECLLIRSTDDFSKFSRYRCNALRTKIFGGISTNMSTSLSGRLSPRATDPKRHKPVTPYSFWIYGRFSRIFVMHSFMSHIYRALPKRIKRDVENRHPFSEVILRSEGDSNSRRALDPYTLSRRASSATRASLLGWELVWKI